MTFFGFEYVCVEGEIFEDTEKATSFGKHIPISVSLLRNLIQELIFLRDPNPRDLVPTFIDALQTLAMQSKAQLNELRSVWNRN